MYPPGSGGNSGTTHGGTPGMEMAPNGGGGTVYYEPTNNGKTYGGGNSAMMSQTQGGITMMNKPGFGNRKDSADSGISEFSSNYSSRKSSWDHSRKSSSLSTTSSVSRSEFMNSMEGESSLLDDVKEEEPYEDPDDDLCEKIVTQVEFYFSDANITKDKFLLKHVKRNKEGFVSLKLISSFKRVKNLTKDWRQVAEAIERKSVRLEVNDLKTKVRRLDALPEYDETTPSRTVVALNLPLERPTIEAVGGIFSACGDIVLVRILRPGNPIPADIKPFANKHPEMTAKVCALVEFERTEFALKAVRELNDMAPKEEPKSESSEEDEENKDENTTPKPNMLVMELTAPPPKTTKNKDDKNKANRFLAAGGMSLNKSQPSFSVGQALPPTRRFSHAGFGQQQQQLHQQHGRENMMNAGNGNANQHNSYGTGDLGPRRRISLYHNMKFTPIAEESSPPPPGRKNSHQHEMGLNPNAPTFTMQQQQQQYSQRSGRYSRQLTQPHYSPPAHHQPHPADIMMAAGPNPMPQHPAAHAAQVAHNAAMAAHAAFQQHSAVAAQAAIVAAAGMSAHPVPYVHHRRISQENVAASGLALPPNVIRLPRGPDKNTRGFQRWCKSRMNTNAPQSSAPIVAQSQVEEQKPRLGMHKRGSHAVPIVAPPKEDKLAAKTLHKKEEITKEESLSKYEKVEKMEKKPENKEKENKQVESEPEKDAGPIASVSDAASLEPSAPPAEESSSVQPQDIPAANVPVVQARIIIAADSDSCSDSGNDSDTEPEVVLDRAEARPQPGPSSFAANLSMDNENEKSR